MDYWLVVSTFQKWRTFHPAGSLVGFSTCNIVAMGWNMLEPSIKFLFVDDDYYDGWFIMLEPWYHVGT